MPPTDAERVAHILDAIDKIQERVADQDAKRFANDEVVHDSVLYQLARIGEAANRLTEEIPRGLRIAARPPGDPTGPTLRDRPV